MYSALMQWEDYRDDDRGPGSTVTNHLWTAIASSSAFLTFHRSPPAPAMMLINIK